MSFNCRVSPSSAVVVVGQVFAWGQVLLQGVQHATHHLTASVIVAGCWRRSVAIVNCRRLRMGVWFTALFRKTDLCSITVALCGFLVLRRLVHCLIVFI